MLLFYSYTRRWWKLLSLTKKPFKNNCLALWSDLFENFPLIIVASLTITNTLNISFCCYHNSIFSTLFGKGVLIIWLLEISLFSQYVGWLSILKNFFSLPPMSSCLHCCLNSLLVPYFCTYISFFTWWCISSLHGWENWRDPREAYKVPNTRRQLVAKYREVAEIVDILLWNSSTDSSLSLQILSKYIYFFPLSPLTSLPPSV